MASISTAPTPFDGADKQEINDWLGHPMTLKLIAGIEATIREADSNILNQQWGPITDENLGKWLRTNLSIRHATLQVLEWIKGASYAAK